MSENKKTILVVDDVPDNIAVLEEILKGDYRVKAATNGETALAIARSESPPDLILLDVMMPGMDGFEVCRNLRQDGAGATIPVIFLTAKSDTADEATGFQAGAVDYIAKPVDPDIVRMRIKAHLEMKEEALRASEIRYRRLFETAKDGILILDGETGRIVDMNPSLVRMLGISSEAILGKSVWDLGILRNIAEGPDILQELRRKEFFSYKRSSLETAGGRLVHVEFSGASYRANNRNVIQCNFRDISDRVSAERQRDELASRLSHYLSTSPTVTYSFKLKDGAAKWQWVSENVGELLGYTSEEALEPGWWFRCVHVSDRPRAVRGISELSENRIFSQEYRFMKKTRDAVWLRDEMRLVKSEGIEPEIVGTLTDITGRKKAESELSLKSEALAAAANAIIITDREGSIQWINAAFGALTGYSPAEALGKNPHQLVYSGKHDTAFFSELWDTILSGRVWRGELINKRKSGELYLEEMTITPVVDDTRRIEHFIAIKTDVTERNRARERLEASLREKEVLLREIHHRVNNNMQMIISLLNLSSKNLVDPTLIADMNEIIERVETMAFIHERFYGSSDISRIDFAEYLLQITDHMRGTAITENREAVIECETEDAILSLEKAFPAGLAVNELLIGALSRAKPLGSPATRIRISLRRPDGGTIEIGVLDDAPNAPAHEGLKPMGMLLIDSITAQLRGTIEFHTANGNEARLRFPIGNEAMGGSSRPKDGISKGRSNG